MARIKVGFEVPDGNKCSYYSKTKEIIPRCQYLTSDNFCLVFGVNPMYTENGYAREKLSECKNSEEKEKVV